mmetsp:Transcript_11850/g.28746  ORF Transcript_11850/g.28746 Transcript_11850/m.28746 type:complete len:209 (-) Transcript_11850:61-687(-)
MQRVHGEHLDQALAAAHGHRRHEEREAKEPQRRQLLQQSSHHLGKLLRHALLDHLNGVLERDREHNDDGHERVPPPGNHRLLLIVELVLLLGLASALCPLSTFRSSSLSSSFRALAGCLLLLSELVRCQPPPRDRLLFRPPGLRRASLDQLGLREASGGRSAALASPARNANEGHDEHQNQGGHPRSPRNPGSCAPRLVSRRRGIHHL